MTNYPEYTKIDYPSQPPEHYWDTSSRCVKCDTKWPNHKLFTKTSVCCGASTMIMGESPDCKWDEAIIKHKRYKFEMFYKKYLNGLNEKEQIWLSTPLDVSEDQIDEGMKILEDDIASLDCKDLFQ